MHNHHSPPQTPSPRRSWLIFACTAFGLLGAIAAPVRPACAAPRRIALADQRVPNEVATARPLGRLPATQAVRLTFVLPLRNPSELDDLIHRLYDPKDPLYGHFLKRGEFAERFGPNPSEVVLVSRYAAAHGLTVRDVSPDRTLIHAEGPVSAAEATFGVHLNTYLGADGRAFYAPDTVPTYPPDIAGHLVGVLGLDTAHEPRHQPLHAITPEEIEAKALVSGGANIYASNSAGLTPSDIHSVYNIPSGTGFNGAGQTLALFEHATYTPSDIPNYQNAFGLPATTVTPVSVGGFDTSAPTTYGDGSDEVTLDIDMMLALAPNASQILVYEGSDTESIYNQIANDDTASVVSTSWYNTADDTGGGTLETAENTAFLQMKTQGQSMFSSSGDGGAYPDQVVLGPNPTLSMQDPGGQPNLTSVGGTALTDNASFQYVSETSWEDTSDKRLHTNSSGNDDGYGTGGGGGIDGYWGFPSYQNGAFTSASNPQGSFSFRNVPDVSLFGDYDEGEYAIYFTARDKNNNPEPGFYGYNGTSAASPLWAAFTALVDEQRVLHGYSNLGFANPALYQLGANPGPYARDFHDIADGSNNLYYNAVTGYDNSTGLGTINNGAALLDDLSATNGATPGNDDFANAYTVFADPADPETVYGSNVGATYENGEPLDTRGAGGSSVWWKYTPAVSGTVTLSTSGSDYTDSIGVYTGSAINALTQITSNDGRGCSVTFAAVAGTTYSISVDGDELNDPNDNYPADEGFITLSVSETVPAPSNDNFANAISVFADPENPGDVTGTNYGASRQSGEPLNTSGSGGHSVWWKWTPPVSGAATIDTFGSNFDTTLGIYTGTAVNALTQVASDDDAGGTLQSQVTFNAVGGTTYYILVDGYSTREGDINLDIAESVTPPGNDDFVSAYTITASPGTPGTVTGDNFGATFETGEPSNTRDSDGASVWWKWTAPDTGTASINPAGTNYDETIGVYTGSSVSSLTQVASGEGDTVVTFSAVSGTTYYISVDGVELNDPPTYGPAEGDITLKLSEAIPAPTVTAFTPASGPVGTSVTITGTNFMAVDNVQFNGHDASYTVLSATQITATVPSGATTGQIQVDTEGGSAFSSASFTVLLPASITSFSPTSGPVGTSVVIHGTGFTSATNVGFHGQNSSFTINSDTQITATVPTGATTGTIEVFNPYGNATSSTSFTVTASPKPTITSFSPTSGPVGATVVITGTNLTGTSVVGFNGHHPTSFTVNSAGTQITTMVPSGATTGTIAVIAPGGEAVSSTDFTVTASAPTITGFSPTSAMVGATVVITGTNLTGTTVVGFNGHHPTSFTVNSAGTQITTTVPVGATTGKIAVIAPGGEAFSATSFTVIATPAPTIASFTPTSGGTGVNVTITGTNLTGTSVVKFNGTNAEYTVLSATSIKAVVPVGASTGRISLVAPGGTATSATNFTYYAAPTITGFTPTSGAVGATVVITGTNLTGTSVVGFNGHKPPSFTVNPAGTQITTTVPTGATTGKIAVIAPGGEAFSATNFTVTP